MTDEPPTAHEETSAPEEAALRERAAWFYESYTDGSSFSLRETFRESRPNIDVRAFLNEIHLDLALQEQRDLIRPSDEMDDVARCAEVDRLWSVARRYPWLESVRLELGINLDRLGKANDVA
jgi:hypothetical protein